MADPRAPALHAYRTLLRSTRIAFQGDARLLSASRHEARKRFAAHRDSVVPGSEEANNKLQEALQVALILRHNIVQGTPVAPLNGPGAVAEGAGADVQSVGLGGGGGAMPEAGTEAGVRAGGIAKEEENGLRYKLRIHADTERGSNESVKLGGGGLIDSGGVGCCGGSANSTTTGAAGGGSDSGTTGAGAAVNRRRRKATTLTSSTSTTSPPSPTANTNTNTNANLH